MILAPLKIVRYPELARWDVKYFLAKLDCRYPLVPLSELVEEHNEKVKPFEEPDKAFKILGVNNTDGIFHAYDSLGRKIKQPYKTVAAGDFAYNPYRVNVGSIGIVPPEHDGAYISPAYVVFRIKSNRILADLLLFILKGDFFNELLRAATAGSVRMNLTYELLRTLEVPLPPMDVQREAVEVWEGALASRRSRLQRMTEIRSSFTQRFVDTLGLRIPKKQAGARVFCTRWSDFARWSLNYNQAARMMMDLAKGNYPVVEMGQILSCVQYGSSEKANTLGAGIPVLRISNVKEGHIDTSDLKHLKLGRGQQSGLLLQIGDILVIRTSGSRDLVGTCAVFHEPGKYVFASYLIRLRVDESLADPDYVAFYLNSPIGRQQVLALSRHIMQNNINAEELRMVQIPIPPKEQQTELVKAIRRSEEQVEAIRKETEVDLKETEDRLRRTILGLDSARRM